MKEYVIYRQEDSYVESYMYQLFKSDKEAEAFCKKLSGKLYKYFFKRKKKEEKNWVWVVGPVGDYKDYI